jgi:signal transduction histidine kinase
MEFLAPVILIAVLINLLLGFFVYIKDHSRKINLLFSISSIITAIWVFPNLMAGVWPIPFWVKFGYGFGALVPLSALLWVIELCEKKITKLEMTLLLGLGIFFFIISFTNDLIVANVKRVYLGGFEGQTGPFFVSYWIYIVGMLFFILYVLISSYLKAKGIKKLQISYVLIGAIFYISTVVIVSFILPLMGIYKFIPLDSPSSLFLLFFTALAITRVHLFEIRVILTEALVGGIALILLVQVLIAPVFWLKIFGFLLLILFSIAGYLLVKSILKEIAMKTEIERAYEVEKRAREELEKIAIQERKLREKDEELVRELKKLDEAKNQFILITQHHLRTPLSIMKGYISMMLDGTYGEINEKLKKPLLNFQKSTEDLIKLVNEFLDISQLRVGGEILNLKDVQIENLLSEIVEELKPEATAKNLYLKLEKPTQPLPQIKADPKKLKAALFNIVDNGIKYTEKGGVNIKLKIENEKLKIIVEDTGMGMTKEEIDTLFTGFFKRSEGAKRAYATGRGIGLFLSDQIIKAHQGKVWAESEGKGKGSTFYIELPIKL